MARSKSQLTQAKRARETARLEKRARKLEKKEARKLAALDPSTGTDTEMEMDTDRMEMDTDRGAGDGCRGGRRCRAVAEHPARGSKHPTRIPSTEREATG